MRRFSLPELDDVFGWIDSVTLSPLVKPFLEGSIGADD